MVAFSMNAYAATAVSLCNCAEMSGSDRAMPCHGMTKADMDAKQTKGQADKSQAVDCKCNKCSCGHCKVPMQAFLHANNTVNDYAFKDLRHPSYKDMNGSIFPYGIDYPPKQIA